MISTDQITSQLIEQLRVAPRVLCFTGGGIAQAAGLATFSGPNNQQIWQYNLIEELLSAEKSADRRVVQFNWLAQYCQAANSAILTATHQALAHWQTVNDQVQVITQNFDGMHARANSASLSNSTGLIELHGNINFVRCVQCNQRNQLTEIAADYRALLNLQCQCGGKFRPDILFYDEAMSLSVWQQAEAATLQVDAVLIIGSSGQALPGALLPTIARRNGAMLIEINLIETDLTAHCQWQLLGDCQQLLPALIDAILH